MGALGLEALPQVGAGQDWGCDGADDLARLLLNPETTLGPETMNIFLPVFLTITLRQKSPRKEAVPRRGEVKGIASFWLMETFALWK